MNSCESCVRYEKCNREKIGCKNFRDDPFEKKESVFYYTPWILSSVPHDGKTKIVFQDWSLFNPGNW